MTRIVDFFEIIDTRKTVRTYTDKIPTDDEIRRIIDSARLAPSACNTQNWKFIAILNKDVKEQLAKAVLDKYDEFEKTLKPEVYSGLSRFKAHSTFFTYAPLLIVCVQTYAPKFLEGILEQAGLSNEEILDIRPDSQLLSMGGAVENMCLTAHALGYGSCWMVAPVIAQDGMRRVLGLTKPDQIVSLLVIGEPKDQTGRPPKKRLNEVLEIIK